MHPADEYARLKSEIRLLETRAKALRDRFVVGRAPRMSNAVEVVVENRRRRVFLRDRLPASILRNPAYWAEMDTPTVTLRSARPPELAVVPTQVPEEEACEVIDSW
ncbi:MAG: hypothetical protein AAGI10_13935 [Pseudomonadota bacterium]